MDNGAVLIIGASPVAPGDFRCKHFRCMYVDHLDEAYRIVADGKRFNLILLSLKKSAPAAFPIIGDILGHLPKSKLMVFENHDELQAFLVWLSSHEAGGTGTLMGLDDTAPVTLGTPSQLPRFDGLIGESPEMGKLKKILMKIAPTGTTLLLQGESGTGKEVIAKTIHLNSSRNREAFIPVDCAAISGNIMESELFGHARGAFTGADRSTLGMIRSADKGTLFLDEIGELPLNMQAKLLRTLQERAVKPVGDSRIYPVDIRVIAATNRNLADAVKKGEFREDLYYRLNAITIYAPPLRERAEDIPLISLHLLDKLVGEGYPRKSIDQKAMATLCAYQWPGNVRELENIIRRAATLSNGSSIDIESLALDLLPGSTAELPENPLTSIAFHEKEAIQKALQKASGNRRIAAELLGISEATLYRRIKGYSL